MATNRDLLKEAIADAKAVKHMAIANAKAALEEAFTPQVNALFSAKLREMEEVEEDEIVNEVEEEEESMEEEAPEEEESEEEESEEEESEEGETKIEDMTEEDLAKLIEDIMLEEFPELAKMRGEEAEDMEEEGAEEEGEEMDMDMDMDLAELLREIEDDSVEESEINLDELLAEIAAEEGMLDEKYEEEEHMKSSMMETELRSELAEAYNAIDVLRSELTEINMLNAKLLYTNKIFKSKNLSESQKVKVLSSFDKAVTVKEVKLVYETLNEGLKVKTVPTHNNVGRASKTTLSPTVKKPIIESNEAFTRMQKLAGLI
jgi:hypothetical protein